MKKAQNILIDLLKSIFIGCIAAGVLTVLSGLILLIAYKGEISHILLGIRTMLLFVAGSGLILASGFIIKKDSRRPLEHINEWRRKFKYLNFVSVIFIASTTLLIIGIAFDYWMSVS